MQAEALLGYPEQQGGFADNCRRLQTETRNRSGAEALEPC